ncbi:glycosyltransferase [Spongiibacter sp. KMU-166]|uniref:Glycosyltransferase n=1 Tax=Spongiibacter thalassae TaxID=2721624 RepID=A0ABX1GIV4_9GAMM|nr:glycosyltransferase [Spongiibacter thalassae]NKI19135.1 glycosyltransferase [Spongiibacter thalassae]
MENMEKASSDNVKVTLLMVTYNQEDYIEEAISAVLCQDYPSVEVIISDDCSTDGTYLRAKSMVEAYQGPFEITLRCNDKNLGLIEHVNVAMRLGSGELVVLAAGDDISFSSRVSRLVEAYLANDRPMLLCSKAKTIDQNGNVLGGEAPDVEIQSVPSVEKALFSTSIYLGASGAWSRELISTFGSINYRGTYEDLVMGFRAALCRSAVYVDEALLYYRVNVGISSQASMLNGADKIAQRIARLEFERDTFSQRRDDLRKHRDRVGFGVAKLIAKIEKRCARLNVRVNFYRKPGLLVLDFFRRPMALVSGVSAEWKFLRAIKLEGL